MRRSFYFALSFFAVGMFMGANVFSQKLIAVFILCLVASLAYAVNKKDNYAFFVGVLFLIIGFLGYNGIYDYKMSKVEEYINNPSSIVLKITDNGTKSISKVKYTAKIKSINQNDKNINAIITLPKKFNFNYGDIIELKDAVLKIPNEAQSSNDFDYRMYLKAKGVFITLYADSINVEDYQRGTGIIRSFYSLRNKISENIYKYILNSDVASIANAIITGDKSNVPNSIKNAFKNAGISHLLAVSGLHLTLLVMYLGCFFDKEKYKVKRYIHPIFSICITICAMFVTGLGYSVIRAGIMLIICNVSKLLGREKGNVNSLMIAAGIIVLLNPYSVFDIGFELSFFATLGILLFCDKIQKAIMSKIKLKYISSLLATTISAQIFTTPIAVFYYGTFSVYSVLANVLAVPLFTPLLVSVMLFSLVSIISPFSPLFRIMGGNIYIFSELILVVAYLISGLPFSVISVSRAELFISLAFVLSLFFIYKAVKLSERKSYKIVCYVLIPICIFGMFFANYDAKNLYVNYIDVGQGSCTHISMPNGDEVLIDCGVSKYYSTKDVGYTVANYLSKKAINEIDYAFLTHYHDDHYSGFLSLMEKGMIATMVIPKVRNEDDMKAYEQIIESAIENDVDIVYFKRGATLNFGDAKIYAISPFGSKELSSNNESVVMKLVYKNTGFLFTGDIEDEMMRELKENELSANVILSPHHGSKTSVYEKFFEATGADYSVISAGEDNSYGHPHKEHLDVLNKNNISFFRTDINKNIYFKVDKYGNIGYKFEEGEINEGA